MGSSQAAHVEAVDVQQMWPPGSAPYARTLSAGDQTARIRRLQEPLPGSSNNVMLSHTDQQRPQMIKPTPEILSHSVHDLFPVY